MTTRVKGFWVCRFSIKLGMMSLKRVLMSTLRTLIEDLEIIMGTI